MKRKFISFLFLINSISLFAKSPNLDSTISAISKTVVSSIPENSIVAILDFSSENEKLGEYIRDYLSSAIMETGSLRLVTRNHLDLIEKESYFQHSGYVNDETALSICEKLGAQALIFGQIEEFGKNYRLQVKMIDVETAVYLLFKNYIVTKDKKINQLVDEKGKQVQEIYSERYSRIKTEENEPKFSLGGGLEGNLYSVKGMAPCLGLSLDYYFYEFLSIGAKTSFTRDLASKNISIATIETLGNIKYYLFSSEERQNCGFFTELEFGSAFIRVDKDLKTSFLIAGDLGYRFNFERIYFDAFIRGGYPVILGIGIVYGFRF